MKKDKLEQKIYKILTQHKKDCKFKDAWERALKPFLIIEPKCMAEEIAKEIRGNK